MSKQFVTKTLIFIFVQIIFIISVKYFLSQANTIYSWDHTVQHSNFVYLNELIQKPATNKIVILKNTISRSIEFSDYNYLSVLPLSIINIILKTSSRESFIFLIHFFYIIPCFLLFYKALKQLNSGQEITSFGFFISNLIFFFNPIVLTNLLRGQSTIDGVILILIVILLLYKNHFSKKEYITKLTISAIILGFLPILHRWYSFFVFSFLITYSLTTIFSKTKKLTFILFGKKILQIIFMFSLSLSTFLLISNSLWKRYIFTDYSTKYSTFKHYDNILTSIHTTLSNIGYIYIILFFVAIYFYTKISKKYISFVLIFFITILSFLKIQNFSNHHYFLIFIPLYLPIAAYFLNRQNTKKTIYLLPILVLSFINSFLYKLPFNNILGLIPTQSFEKPLNNIEIIKNVSNYLVNLPDVKKIYFVSKTRFYNTSNFVYFTCTLNKSYLSLCDKFIKPAYLVTRDPFPIEFSTANYVMTIEAKIDQPAVNIFKNFIENNPHNYQKMLDEFKDDHNQIFIYKVIKPPNNQQIDLLIDDYNRMSKLK